MVLEEEVVRVASLAVASGRSLFLYGPPGNGKTSLGRLLHRALRGEIWIPHAIGVGNSIIRVFDPLCHEAVSLGADESRDADRRWAKIRRPLIVAGGELTLSALDLAFIGSQRFYEAPLHMKSNGGLFLVDDFGRQRVEPHQLLNRWIVPLEHGMDHLSLRTGQQIQVPFRQMLVIATNLNPAQVTDAAFLRRMGYRAELRNPSSERYAKIFELYSARSGMALPPGLLDYVLERYRAEDRAPRACEPRDLIDRVGDICRFEGKAPALTEEHVDLAWTGYFGNLLR
jgi:predicted ATPase with chaperone activity